MKSYVLLILSFLILGCYSTIYEKTKIDNIDISIDIMHEDSTQDIQLCHLYFENINKKDKSFGINYFKSINNLKVSVFPGIYNIYAYGLIDKTDSLKKVYSYYINKNKKCFDNFDILIYLKKLYPQVELINNNDLPILKVNIYEINEIFSLSSLSLKQANDRVRSLDFIFNDIDKTYTANITLYKNGDWYYNISYNLKSKIDDLILKKDNIKISTSNFNSIYLGNYQYVK